MTYHLPKVRPFERELAEQSSRICTPMTSCWCFGDWNMEDGCILSAVVFVVLGLTGTIWSFALSNGTGSSGSIIQIGIGIFLFICIKVKNVTVILFYLLITIVIIVGECFTFIYITFRLLDRLIEKDTINTIEYGEQNLVPRLVDAVLDVMTLLLYGVFVAADIYTWALVYSFFYMLTLTEEELEEIFLEMGEMPIKVRVDNLDMETVDHFVIEDEEEDALIKKGNNALVWSKGA